MRISTALSRSTGWIGRTFFNTRRRALLTLIGTTAALLLGVAICGYLYITHGGMTARQRPLAIEVFVAGRLVDWSVPADARAMQNPLPLDARSADAAAGRDLYQKNCETCHGFDGSGHTTAGLGLYPPPANLCGPATLARTDGTLFYLIRNGIRNTGMPAWQLTDQQTWQLVVYIRALPKTVAPAQPAVAAGGHAQFVGSAACADCHRSIYDRWKSTLMANVVRDPKTHPEAIIPDFSRPDPLLTFTVNDIAFVYGSKWKQRYFKKVGDDYYPLPAQWDVTHHKWRPYLVKDDWWVPYYPADNAHRPTGSTCDGCHSVNYNISDKTVTEWNVGCEKCHGPGSDHVKNPTASAAIINPARLGYVDANDTCIQCHSQGRPLSNPVNGRYYDWPVGFQMGLRLSNFWKLEEHKLGETSFTHFAEGTAHKNRMQGNDYVMSQMYTHGVSCFTCHDAHGASNPSLLRKPSAVLCLDCHGPQSPNGPHAPTLEAHTHHAANSPGSQCIECHMPKIAQTLGDVNVRSHTFRFVYPGETDRLKIPNACNVCHADKTTQWATDALNSWSDRSPWRSSRAGRDASAAERVSTALINLLEPSPDEPAFRTERGRLFGGRRCF